MKCRIWVFTVCDSVIHTFRGHSTMYKGLRCALAVITSVSHSLKKGRVLARKRALLMREIHRKGTFVRTDFSKVS